MDEQTDEQHTIDAVNLNPENIHNELARVSADLNYFSSLLSEANLAVMSAKIDLKEVEGSTYLTTKKMAEASGKKTTEANLSAVVDTADTVIRARRVLASSDSEKKRLEGIVSAISTKSQMLISLSALMRKEMESLSH